MDILFELSSFKIDEESEKVRSLSPAYELPP